MKNAKDMLVGIIVPIYNVESYLRECLDSIINQTYKNLKIILVNDGSTDSSLKIAKEYANKDKRIILFDKENGGLSSARNVGIEYFCGNINIESIANGGGSQQNLKIKNIYCLDSTFSEIDYIIFIDSDDYWELDIIEKCLKYSDGVDIVKFEYNVFYDSMKEKEEKLLRIIKSDSIITPKELIDDYKKNHIVFFCSVHNIFTRFKIIKDNNVRFINDIIYEDVHFGIVVVLSLANKIYQANQKMYHYRVRPNSTLTSNHTNINKLSPSMQKQYAKIGIKDMKQAKKIFQAYCMTITAIEIVKYLEKNTNNKDEIIDQFMRWLCSFVYEYLESKNDPYNIIDDLRILEPYISNCHLYTKIAIKYPRQYQLFAREISFIIKVLKYIKRKIQRIS